jgi:hypothetical protein
MSVIRILDQVKLEKGDELAVQDGTSLMKDSVLLVRNGKEVTSPVSGRVMLKDDTLYLMSKEIKVEIANGSTIYIKAGDIVEANKPIGEFDPFNEPIIAESDGYVHYEDIIIGSIASSYRDDTVLVVDATFAPANPIAIPTLSYQWYSIIIEDDNEIKTAIEGATTDEYRARTGKYRCEVTAYYNDLTYTKSTDIYNVG